MAMDSPIKRAAALGMMRPWMRSHWIDGAKGTGWRAGTGNAYPVANFQSPSGISPVPIIMQMMNQFNGGQSGASQ